MNQKFDLHFSAVRSRATEIFNSNLTTWKEKLFEKFNLQKQLQPASSPLLGDVYDELMLSGKPPILKTDKIVMGGTQWVTIITTSAPPLKIIFRCRMKSFLSDYPSVKSLSMPILCTARIDKPTSATQATRPSVRLLTWAETRLPSTLKSLRKSNSSPSSRPESTPEMVVSRTVTDVTPSVRLMMRSIIFTSVRGFVIRRNSYTFCRNGFLARI